MRVVQLFIALLPMLALAFGLAAELPEDIAIHWDLWGHANGSAPRGIAFVVALLAIGGTSLYALLRSRKEATSSGPTELASLSFVATLLTGVWAGICVANHRVLAWEEASLSLWASMLFVGTACALAWVVGKVVRKPAADTKERASIGLRDGQRGVFFSQVASPLMSGLALVLLALGVVVLLNASWVTAAGLCCLSLVLVMFARVTVSIDEAGMHIAYGPLSFPRQTIPLRDVVLAEPVDVRPMAYGGWGYRGSLQVVGKAALVLRAGVGIKLSLAHAKTFVVTVDDAASAAGLINDLVRIRAAETAAA
ncbi:MAG: DUF1648 domain-containing protein [Polyangiales bacterium]